MLRSKVTAIFEFWSTSSKELLFGKIIQHHNFMAKIQPFWRPTNRSQSWNVKSCCFSKKFATMTDLTYSHEKTGDTSWNVTFFLFFFFRLEIVTSYVVYSAEFHRKTKKKKKAQTIGFLNSNRKTILISICYCVWLVV